MNKQQIIYAVVAMVLVILGVGLLASRNQHNEGLRASATALAEDLVTRTNSSRLVGTPLSLKACLARLLTSPSGAGQVSLGDDGAHTTSHGASARIILTNAEHQALVLRVKPEGSQFRVLSFEMTNSVPLF